MSELLLLSLPTQGAWIEIRILRHLYIRQSGRSPHRERGLKCIGYNTIEIYVASLPTQGAWIEIVSSMVYPSGRLSLPTQGAWIEIRRGRKTFIPFDVAPHTGSVD